MTPQPQFEIRKLEVGEKLNEGTDVFLNTKERIIGMSSLQGVLTEVDYPHYRIQPKPQPMPEAKEETKAPEPIKLTEQDCQFLRDVVNTPSNSPLRPIGVPLVEPAPSVEASIDPGEGWRLLEIGEVIELNDEFQDLQGNWKKTFDSGLTHIEKHLQRRRRIPAPASDDNTTGYYIDGKEVTQDELYRHTGAKVFDGLKNKSVSGSDQAPIADVWSHERAEYRKAIDKLQTERDELKSRWSTFAKKYDTLCLEQDRIREERDALKAELAAQGIAEIELNNTIHDLKLELATIKQKQEEQKWRTPTQSDKGKVVQIRDSDSDSWRELTLIEILPGNLKYRYVTTNNVPDSCTMFKQCRIRDDVKGVE